MKMETIALYFSGLVLVRTYLVHSPVTIALCTYCEWLEVKCRY